MNGDVWNKIINVSTKAAIEMYKDGNEEKRNDILNDLSRDVQRIVRTAHRETNQIEENDVAFVA